MEKPSFLFLPPIIPAALISIFFPYNKLQLTSSKINLDEFFISLSVIIIFEFI